MGSLYRSLQTDAVKICVTNCWWPGDEQRFHKRNDAWMAQKLKSVFASHTREVLCVCRDMQLWKSRNGRLVRPRLEQWLSNIWLNTYWKKCNLAAWSGAHTHMIKNLHLTKLSYVPHLCSLLYYYSPLSEGTSGKPLSWFHNPSNAPRLPLWKQLVKGAWVNKSGGDVKTVKYALGVWNNWRILKRETFLF